MRLSEFLGNSFLKTANIGPAGGPKEFDIAFEFEEPFQYNPADGNLLIDWIVVGPAGWVGDDRVDTSTISRWISNEDRDATHATDYGTGVTVMSFRFIPEPSTILLTLLLTLIALAITRYRIRRR